MMRCSRHIAILSLVLLLPLLCTGAPKARSPAKRCCDEECYQKLLRKNMGALRGELNAIRAAKNVCADGEAPCARRYHAALKGFLKKVDGTITTTVKQESGGYPDEVYDKAQRAWEAWLASATKSHLLLFPIADREAAALSTALYQTPFLEERIEALLKYYHDYMEYVGWEARWWKEAPEGCK